MEATILSFSTDIPDVRTPYLDKPNAQSRAKGCPEWDRCRLMGRRPSDGAHKSLMIGGPGKIRTPDLLVRSQTLYPTELRARTVPLRSRGAQFNDFGRGSTARKSKKFEEPRS